LPTYTPPARIRRPRPLQFASFLAALAWYFCAQALATSAARGLASRFYLGDPEPLIEAAFLIFLVVLGLALLRALERRLAPLRITLGLPKRATSRDEWATGAALGWGIAVASVLPMVLGRALNVHLWTSPRGFELLALSLMTLAISTLASDVSVHGYAFQRLIDAIGPVRATLAMALLEAIYTGLTPAASSAAIAISVLLSIVLSLCWLRTHAVWLMWGLHFAMSASIAALFGLPLSGDTNFSSIVDSRATGPIWLTGGGYGPAGALFSILVLLAAIPILIRLTTDYAWDYTHPPIIPGGYDVTIPPPAAHLAMEQAAMEQAQAQPVNPASLVQILPAAPRRSSGNLAE
jgi:hypothetical protein